MSWERKRLKSISYLNYNVWENFSILNGGRNMMKKIYRKTILVSQIQPTVYNIAMNSGKSETNVFLRTEMKKKK